MFAPFARHDRKGATAWVLVCSALVPLMTAPGLELFATGLFAWKAVNGSGADGLLHGNPAQLWTQLIAVAATVLLAAPATFLILKLVDALVGLRVAEDDELAGLDLSQHSENAYALGGPTLGEHVAPSGGSASPLTLREAALAKTAQR